MADADDLVELARAGVTCLKRGDARGAREKLRQAVALGMNDPSVWHALALACQRTGDAEGLLEATGMVLSYNSRHVSSLMLRASYYESVGDDRAALSYYTSVANIAAAAPSRTEELEAAHRQAEQYRATHMAKMYDHLLRELATVGYKPGGGSERFARALSMLRGEKKPYLQQPRAFYFPELANVQFFPRDSFSWIADMEAATDDICAELEAIMPSEQDFVPYIEEVKDRPVEDQFNLMGSKDWTAFFLLRDGSPVPENVARCPKTMSALGRVPLTNIPGRCPMALFSRLRPGAHIPPHHGFINTRLICHLPLIVPPGCRFRVGNDEREWRRGEVWVFDDTIEHEAINTSGETRVVLIFEVWRPDLTEEERMLVAKLIEAVDTYAGDTRQSWHD